MRNSKLVLALSAVLPGIAFAAPPTGESFAGWTMDAAGTITNTCQTGFTCSATPVSDMGFIQVQMTENSTGNTYFKTIIASDDGSGETFSTVSFVGSGAGVSGIAAEQSISSATTAGGPRSLTSSTTLLMGSFNNGTEDTVALSQSISDPAAAPTFMSGFTYNKAADGTSTTTLSQRIVEGIGTDNGFADQFTFVEDKDAAGVSTSKTLDIASGLVLNPGGTVADQAFNFSSRSGAASTAETATVPNGNNVTWMAGAEVERTLISQSVATAGDFGYVGVGSMMAGMVSDFSLVGAISETYADGTSPFSSAAPDTTAIPQL